MKMTTFFGFVRYWDYFTYCGGSFYHKNKSEEKYEKDRL